MAKSSCLTKTLLATIRVLLVLSCISILVLSLVGMWYVSQVENVVFGEYFFGFPAHLKAFITLAFVSVMAVLGTHGAFTKNPRYLRMFALVASAFLVYLILFDRQVDEDLWARVKKQFAKNMEDYAKEYQPKVEPGERANRATRAWDLVQKGLMCCGLEGPSDWAKKWDFDTLPDSCCVVLARSYSRTSIFVVEDKCLKRNSFQEGCKEKLLEMEKHDSCAETMFFFILFIVKIGGALILAKHSERAFLEANSPNGPTRNYHKFDGSAAHVQRDGPPTKQPPFAPAGAPLYPSVQAFEKH